MNRVFLVLCSCLLLLASCHPRHAATTSSTGGTFEGTIKYKLSASGGPMAQMMSGQLPSGMTFAFLGPKMLMTIAGMPGGKDMVMLTDAAKGESYRIDHQAHKVQKIKVDTAQAAQRADSSNFQLEETNETSDIMGYKCKKYLAKMDGPMSGKMEMIFWITDKIKPATNPNLHNGTASSLMRTAGKGFPLKLTLKMDAMDIQLNFTATEINTARPESSLFELPQGYAVEEISPEDLGRSGF